LPPPWSDRTWLIACPIRHHLLASQEGTQTVRASAASEREHAQWLIVAVASGGGRGRHAQPKA